MGIANWRADFPILAQQIHDKPLAYLDNGATAQKPQAVLDAMTQYYQQDNANVHRGVHTLSERATHAYEQGRTLVKNYINAAKTKEIIFSSGTTAAINCVAQSYGLSQLQSGDEIILSTHEHHSNIVPWQLLAERVGAVIRVIPMLDNGELDQTGYEDLLNKKTKIVAVTHVSNVLGVINPIKTMTEKAHAVGAIMVVDGAQALPHFRVDVQELNCDFYAFSSHKMFGPTGLGILYGKEKLLDAMPPYQGGGEMIETVSFTQSTYAALPHKFEAGTPNIAAVVGLSAAINYLQSADFMAMQKHEQDLLSYASQHLADIPGLRLIADLKDKAPVISFVLQDVHPHDMGTILDHEGVAVRVGHHCAMPLMQRLAVPATVRASLAFYNNEADVDALLSGLQQVRKIFG